MNTYGIKAWKVVGYVYAADIYCPACIVRALPTAELSPAAYDMQAEDVLEQVAAAMGVDRADETTYDSDDFPKVVFASDAHGDVCGSCGEELLS